MRHGRQLAAAFAETGDTLVSDFDIGVFLRQLGARCVESTAVDAVGLLVGDRRGRPSVVAGSSVAAEGLAAAERDGGDGPGRDCFRTGHPVGPVDLLSAGRWPRFAVLARDAGFGSVEAVPMRLRDSTIGAVSLFVRMRCAIDPEDRAIAQALAGTATIGLLRRRRVDEQEALAVQLRGAMASRILVEQAKGVLAEREGMSVDAAFAGMRLFARNRNLRLRDVAATVVSGGDLGPLSES